MNFRSLAAAATLAATAFTTLPAAAVTNGELDGNNHPNVGLMVALDGNGNPLWRCSGTLIAPKLYLTAGHCTEAPAARAEIWFDADLESGIPGNGYPFNGSADGVTLRPFVVGAAQRGAAQHLPGEQRGSHG